MNSLVPHPSQDKIVRQDIGNMGVEARTEFIRAAINSGEKLPAQLLTSDRPEHLTVAYLLAAGRTRDEISKATGLSKSHLSQLVQQPWFKARLREITEAAGTDMVKSFLNGEVLPSLEVLRTVRDNPDERGATRVAAANSILDRFMGKPTVHVESKTNLNIHSAADAKDQVQSELEKVDAELRRLGVNSTAARAN